MISFGASFARKGFEFGIALGRDQRDHPGPTVLQTMVGDGFEFRAGATDWSISKHRTALHCAGGDITLSLVMDSCRKPSERALSLFAAKARELSVERWPLA